LPKIQAVKQRIPPMPSGRAGGIWACFTEAIGLLHASPKSISIKLFVCLSAWLALAPSVFAQLSLESRSAPRNTGISSAFLERQRSLERENQRKLQKELPISQKFRLDYGGWYNFYFFLFDDGFNSSRTLRQHELRLWASFSADQGVHKGYVRGRFEFEDFNPGDNFDPNDEDDGEGPELERGWYVFDLAQALRVYEGMDIPWEMKVKLGRDLVYIGTGYAIDVPLDHIMIQGEFLDFQTTYILGQTPLWTENIDRSDPVEDRSERIFHIIEQKYVGWDNHEPFWYIAWQDDRTTESPNAPFQNYEYDSRYIGFGSTGELVENLRYSTEWVFERGDSYGDRRFLHTNEIDAWAFDHRFDYIFRTPYQPVVSLEYMFASGDPNRLGSPTNAEGGNTFDFTDNSFVGFGFRDTGIAFSPRLSNIHIWRMGGSFRPFPNKEALRNMEVGTDWYLYWKNRSSAAVSDPLANQQSGYLGWEMDYYTNWRITNDLAWTARFGMFFPGSAFEDQTTRTFLLTGLTWSF